MNIVIIIQDRMGSTRLPGKVMLPLQEQSVLSHVIQRASAVINATAVYVATSDLVADNIIAAEALKYDALTSRGSESDVLSRYYEICRSSTGRSYRTYYIGLSLDGSASG